MGYHERTEILVVRSDPRAGGAFKNHIEEDVGFDLEVWNPDSDVTTVLPMSFGSLTTGLHIKVGANSWGMIRPRSSTFYKRGLFVAEGTIDPGYTGPLFITVFNPKPLTEVIHNGERLAQLIPVLRFKQVSIRFVDDLPKTIRGSRGFGSTGK